MESWQSKHFMCCAITTRHTELENTVRYLSIEVDDVREITKQTEVCVRQTRHKDDAGAAKRN